MHTGTCGAWGGGGISQARSMRMHMRRSPGSCTGGAYAYVRACADMHA